MRYVIAGPTTVGNQFGYHGVDVPAERFAVVEDGEYSNGGHGPSTVDGKLYRSRERAEAKLAEIGQEKPLRN